MSETDVNESFKKDDPSHCQESSSDSKPTNADSAAKSSFFNNLKNFGKVMAETASKMYEDSSFGDMEDFDSSKVLEVEEDIDALRE